MGFRGIVGHIFGIPIRIDRSWFIIVTLVAWTLSHGYFPSYAPGLSPAAYLMLGIAASILLFVCVVLHELGHSLTARAHGIKVHQVTLFIFGGVAQIAEDPKRPSVELKVALAGPLVTVLIICVCIFSISKLTITTTSDVMAAAIINYLTVINIVILVFNLLPGFPLDGGRVLRAALWAWSGNFWKATKIASLVGSGLGLGLMCLGVWAIIRGVWVTGMWYILLGFFLRDAARISYRQSRFSGA